MEKLRTKEITESEARETLTLFENDFSKYNFVATDSLIIEQARNLTTQYGIEGLRTLDSIQLSTCIELENQVDVFFTADKLLRRLIELEGLPTQLQPLLVFFPPTT